MYDPNREFCDPSPLQASNTECNGVLETEIVFLSNALECSWTNELFRVHE